MSVLRGVDGCKAGWLSLSVQPDDTRVTARLFDLDARELFAEPALVTAIDIPIGLPTNGPRPVDAKARRLLGGRTSSVFPTPVRAALDATSYEEACEASFRACGKKLNRQTFDILPRIRTVDSNLRETPILLQSVYEVHPEVCFVYWNEGRAPRHPKASGFGFLERLTVVQAIFGSAAEQVSWVHPAAGCRRR